MTKWKVGPVGKQTKGQMKRQINIWNDDHTVRSTNVREWTYRQKDRSTNIHTKTNRWTNIPIYRLTDRHED